MAEPNTAEVEDGEVIVPEIPDEDDDLPPSQKTIIQIHPISPSSQSSRCTVCTRLNPSLDGLLLKGQRIKVEGGKWTKGDVRLRLRTYKQCGPDVNPNCPASEVRIVVGTNVEAKAREYVRALADQNLVLVSQISGEMSVLDEALRASFNAAVSALQAPEARDG